MIGNTGGSAPETWRASVTEVQRALSLVTLLSDVEAIGGRAAVVELMSETMTVVAPERLVLILATIAASLLDSPTQRSGVDHLRSLGLAAELLQSAPPGAPLFGDDGSGASG